MESIGLQQSEMTVGRFSVAGRDSFRLCRESKWGTPRRRLGGSADPASAGSAFCSSFFLLT
jgi:hypothetical protein